MRYRTGAGPAQPYIRTLTARFGVRSDLPPSHCAGVGWPKVGGLFLIRNSPDSSLAGQRCSPGPDIGSQWWEHTVWRFTMNRFWAISLS